MPTQTQMRERTWVALILLGVTCLTFYRLGAGSLWDQDETKYTQVAREILETGDPVTLHINGKPWFVHPPFYMWLVAATGKAAGFTELTARVWSAAFSVLAVYATILIGRGLFGPRTGVLAGAILAATFQFLVQSRLAVFDTVLLAWMLLAVYAFVRAYQGGHRADYLRFFLFAGLATLTKGPIGMLLPALVIVPFVAVRRAWHRWREIPWAAGLALYAIVGLSWYAIEAWLHGGAFVSTVLGYYGVGRFVGVVENQAGSWSYYIPIVLAGGIPWTAFWPAAVVHHFRRRRVDDGSLFVLIWCAVTFVFYSAAGTKLPNYMLPIYPLAAVGVAALWDAALRDARGGEGPSGPAPYMAGASPESGISERGASGKLNAGRSISISAWALGLMLAVLYVGIAGYLSGLYPGPFRSLGHVLLVPAGALAAGAGLAIVLAASRRRLAALAALCVAMAVTWIGVLTWIVPIVEAQKPMKPLALEILSALRPGDRIVGYRLSIYSSLIFYTDHRVEWVETPADLRRAVCAPGRVFVVITQQELGSVAGALPGGLQSLADRLGTDVLLKPDRLQCAR